MTKKIFFLSFLSLFIFVSCEKKKILKSIVGTYSIVNTGSPGGMNPSEWTYELKVEKHDDRDHYLVFHNFVNIGGGIYNYTVEASRTQPTEFSIVHQHPDSESEWITGCTFTHAFGHFSGDSIYYEYEYTNVAGEIRWGIGSGIKMD